MAVTINITRENRINMLVGALEGGSNYWYSILQPSSDIVYNTLPNEGETSFAEKMYKAIETGATIEIHDIEDETEKLGEINIASIERGEQIMADKFRNHFADIVDENDDASTADVWFQLCCLGDVIYG